MLKHLPVGVQTFRKIRSNDYLYVDKTEWIYRLVQEGEVYFLSRPRRFGKSLLISTLEELFSGHRELFEGLWIHGSDYGWTPHPVIRVDFSMLSVRTADALEFALGEYLKEIAADLGIEARGHDIQQQLRLMIRALSERGPVVVLVDEYDKPLIDNLLNVDEARRIRDVLRGFYTILKGMDEYLRFVFLTGVSKFSKVGVFSGLNNLADITMDNRYSAMLGITQEELETYFADHIAALAAALNVSHDELLARIHAWYDGFCFSRRCIPVYNPFSLLRLFDSQEFRNYWFETGTPTFLIDLIREREYDVQELEHLTAGELAFSSYEVDNLSVIPLLFQTGYLTIKEYDEEGEVYHLGYPNREVEDAFTEYLLGSFSYIGQGRAGGYAWKLVQALRSADLDRFFSTLEAFFADIPYDIQIRRERYYQTIFYLVFKLIGMKIEAEVRTNRGRVDAVAETADRVYIFEFKMDEGDAQAALHQIRERGYAEKYRAGGKTIHFVGVRFDSQKRGIVDWQVETEE